MHRVARHAGTLTAEWHDRVVAELAAAGVAPAGLAFVELVALTAQTSAIWSFRRAAGLSPWPLPQERPGAPTGRFAEALDAATLNWVPVAAPADQVASVVQAFTSLPEEHERTWALADAQYIPDAEMVDPHWTRGTLTRPQMELVAARVAQLRECFF